MEISNKKLQKALTYYEKGKYKEALKICNKVLSKEYNNEEALTLEGEILYKADMIDDAIVTWKINAEYNHNEIAKKHLARIDTDVKKMALSYTSIYSEDEEYKRLIIDAFKETRKDVPESTEPTIFKTETGEIKVKEPETLEETISNGNKEDEEVKVESPTSKEESKNEQPIVEESIEEPVIEEKTETPAPVVEEKVEAPIIEKVVKDEPKAPIIEKVVKDEPKAPIIEEKIEKEVEAPVIEEVVKKQEPIQKEVKEEKASEPTVKPAVREVPKTNNVKPATIKTTSKNSFNKKIVAVIIGGVIIIGGGIAIYKSQTPKANTPVKTEVNWTNFNTQIQGAINNQNYAELYSLLSEAPQDKVPQAEQTAYKQGLQVMKENGVQYFYDNGMNAYNQKEYNTAIGFFQKGLKFADGTYLEPHLIYFIGASYSGLQDHAKAVDYYKEYLQKFPNADIYNSGCLYVLAKYYYSKGDVKEAQGYAQTLEDKYPNSPYNNNDIANILANK